MKKLSVTALLFLLMSFVLTACHSGQESTLPPSSEELADYMTLSLEELKDMLENPDEYKSITIQKYKKGCVLPYESNKKSDAFGQRRKDHRNI